MRPKIILSKAKILILGKLPPPFFGPAVATQILLNSELKNSYTIFHLNTNVHGEISTIGKWGFDKLIKNLTLYLRLAWIIMKNRPDITLVPISQSTLGFIKDSAFIVISRALFRKVILHLRGGNFSAWLQKSSFLTRAYVYAVLNMTQGVIVLGNKLKKILPEYYPSRKIFVVPNGADYNFSGSSSYKTMPKTTILYLSNLQASKGIEDVIHASAILKNEYMLAFQLNVVGAWRDTATRQTCVSLVKKHDLPVKFYDQSTGDQKKTHLETADLFVFTPRMPEGHPWVIIEAMAAGLPIISTDQGAITESVRDGVNGFIVGQSNPQQIADRLKFLLDNPQIRKKMGEESRKSYLSNFTEKRMVEKLAQCFETVLKSA